MPLKFSLSDMENPMPTGTFKAVINNIVEKSDRLNYSVTIFAGGTPRDVYINVFLNSSTLHSFFCELYERFGIPANESIDLDAHIGLTVNMHLSLTYGSDGRPYYVLDWYGPAETEEELPF